MSIWENKERKFDYGEKLSIITYMKEDLKGKNYDFVFDDPDSYAQGAEFFYLINHQNIVEPSSFNGKNSLETFFHKYEFSSKKGEVTYAVSGIPVWKDYDNGWIQVFEHGRYRLYKKSG